MLPSTVGGMSLVGGRFTALTFARPCPPFNDAADVVPAERLSGGKVAPKIAPFEEFTQTDLSRPREVRFETDSIKVEYQ